MDLCLCRLRHHGSTLATDTKVACTVIPRQAVVSLLGLVGGDGHGLLTSGQVHSDAAHPWVAWCVRRVLNQGGL